MEMRTHGAPLCPGQTCHGFTGHVHCTHHVDEVTPIAQLVESELEKLESGESLSCQRSRTVYIAYVGGPCRFSEKHGTLQATLLNTNLKLLRNYLSCR